MKLPRIIRLLAQSRERDRRSLKALDDVRDAITSLKESGR